MRTFLIPIQGLTVETAWRVGPVTLRPGRAAIAQLKAAQPNVQLRAELDSLFSELRSTAFAETDASDKEAAFEIVAIAVDVLRVYQHVQFWKFPLGQFGIAGDLARGVVPYGQMLDGRSGHGWLHRGSALGWTFNASDQWKPGTTFESLAAGIGDAQPAEGPKRAMVGVHYLSQALADQRPAFKMVALVTALEALLLPRRGRVQTFRLARAVAFFGCGRHDGNLCGRSRETCPYLDLDPDRAVERNQLRLLRELGAAPPWRCSEWHRVVDWYDLRSDVVHGAGPNITLEAANNALFWVLRYLAEPILEWLIDHPIDPISELEAALRALPPAPDWSTRIGALPESDDQQDAAII